jgi:LmbE family N-acetylglucosaminyl deacetylase
VRFDEVPARALAIFAHPDDPEVACAGSLAAWIDAGAEARVVIANSGDKGRGDVAQRAAEVAAAAGVLGLAGCEILGIPDGATTNSLALQEQLVAAIRSWRPEVVIAPDPKSVFFGDTYVNHHDHRELGWAALDACAPMAGSPRYFPDAGPAHAVPTMLLAGTLAPDCWVDGGGAGLPRQPARRRRRAGHRGRAGPGRGSGARRRRRRHARPPAGGGLPPPAPRLVLLRTGGSRCR